MIHDLDEVPKATGNTIKLVNDECIFRVCTVVVDHLAPDAVSVDIFSHPAALSAAI